jgi:hypothetical protein
MKRAHERIPLDLEISFLQFNTKYSGTVKDISKNGMYIESDTPLPFNSKLDIHMPFKASLKILIDFNNEVLEVPVQVKRLVTKGTSFIGMGVMLLNSSPSYMDFMSGLTPTH